MAAANILAGIAGSILKSAIIKPLATGFSIIFMWVFHGLSAASPVVAKQLADKIAGTYFTGMGEWAPWVKNYMEQLTGKEIKLEDIMMKGSIVDQTDLMENLGEKFLTPMLGLIMPKDMKDPKVGLKGAQRFMATNLQFQMSAWLLHMLGDMQSFGMFKSLKDLPNAISWSYGIGWLSWLVMGTPFRIAIAEPLEKLFNAMYTNVELSKAELIDAYHAGFISKKDFNIGMDHMGYDSVKRTALYNMGKKGLSNAELREFRARGWLSESQVADYLGNRGYSPSEAKLLASLIEGDKKKDALDDIVKEVEAQAVNGDVDMATMEIYWDLAKMPAEEQHLRKSLIKLKSYKTRSLSQAQVIKAWKENYIGIDIAKDKLSTIGYSQDDIELLLKMA